MNILNNRNKRTNIFKAMALCLIAAVSFTLVSCDNPPGNGDAARAATVGLARLSDPGLADWVAAHATFPNGMVDRIAPATGPHERAMAARFGLADDPVPVTCEPFRQWVLEDRFAAAKQRGARRRSEEHTTELQSQR